METMTTALCRDFYEPLRFPVIQLCNQVPIPETSHDLVTGHTTINL